MGMTINTPFIAHSELTDEIYVIDKKAKYRVTDQVMKAVVATNRAIPKADYEARLKADMVAMLTDLQLEIEELDLNDYVPDYQKGADETREYIADLLQQKIDALKMN